MSNMKYANYKTKIVAALLVAVVSMNGCSFRSRARDHSDKYKSAEEYCEYWFGPCKEVEAISDEYDLEFENFAAGNEIKGSPSIRIHTDRVLSSEDNREILQTVMGMLDKFDSERKVFNKKHDNISVAVSVWSPPWEKDEKTGALYHVENDTFGDNYQDQ